MWHPTALTSIRSTMFGRGFLVDFGLTHTYPVYNLEE